MQSLVAPFVGAVLGIGLFGASGMALAEDVAAPEAKPAVKSRSVTEDPMDRLRERLAAKLGTAKAVEAPNPGVLRVVNRNAEGAATRVAVTLPPPPHKSPVPAVAAKPAHWGYEGEVGPDRWAALAPEFASCGRGARQSPIDIRDGIKLELDPVQFDYRATAFRVIDNGHTVQVNLSPGNSIDVQGRRYELQQFHFHRPAEERIDGRLFDLGVHLVHRDAEGRLAVVAVLLERGRAQPVVQAVWNNLPLEKGEELAARTAIDLNQLLPDERSYVTYMGSLTTPPCSEGVLWMVMKQPVPISPEQSEIFARLYPMNARPVQQASGRLIKESR